MSGDFAAPKPEIDPVVDPLVFLASHWDISGDSDAFTCDCGYPLGNGTGDLYDRHRRHVADLMERRERRGAERIAARCQEWATARFDEHGPMDARGAALWDVAAWIREGDDA